jgi:hypothetical protein
MSTVLRIISSVVGLALLVGTVVLVFNLVSMERDASVLLAGYGAIGGIIVGVFLLFYAITGKWHPDLKRRKGER